MTHFFRGTNPTSNLQQAIEKVTDPSQNTEDWALIMQICDYVASKEESARETMKIIRKRLQVNPTTHGWNTIVLTLTLLEALTKNCGKGFHLQVAHRDFLKELKNVIGPKNNPPLPIQERVLGLIQTWALAFRSDADLKAVDQFYQECKQQGLVFPPAESETTIRAAVPATASVQATVEQRPSYGRSASYTGASNPPRELRSSSDTGVSAEQWAKLRSELDVVQTNSQVFGEMLVTLQPGEENPEDFELLMELYKTCQQMHTRIVELLSQITNDEITVDLLRHNDELNHSFKTFENYMQERERRCSTRTKATPLAPTRNDENVPALIRFDDEPATLTTNMQNMQISSASAIPKRPTASTASHTRSMNVRSPAATTRTLQINDDVERDVQEVEQWLKFQGDESDGEEAPRREATGTSAAFNNFLEKRASAAPTEANANLYANMQPVSNRVDPSNTRM